MDSGIIGARRLVARSSVVFVFAALLFGALAGSASAETVVTRDVTFSARATFPARVGEARGEGFVEIFNEGKFEGAAIACLQVTIGETFEEGCAEIGDGYDIAENATSAWLAATPVDLYVNVCEGKVCDIVYSRTVTIEASWSADGRPQRVREELTDGGPGDPCTTKVTIRGFFAPATAEIVLDGSAVAGAGDVQRLNSVTKRTCA